jgi:hypothetical protein
MLLVYLRLLVLRLLVLLLQTSDAALYVRLVVSLTLVPELRPAPFFATTEHA